jgi:hypothetical protein
MLLFCFKLKKLQLNGNKTYISWKKSQNCYNETMQPAKTLV